MGKYGKCEVAFGFIYEKIQEALGETGTFGLNYLQSVGH
jgi:hypothetical protein